MRLPIVYTPDMQTRADALAEAQKNYNALTLRHRTQRDSLEPLSHSIASALACGAPEEAEKFRAERSAAEADIRDLGAAEAIAERKLSDAERELARAEIEPFAAEIRRKVTEFEQLVTKANALSSELLALRPAYSGRFAAAQLGDLYSGPLLPSHVAEVRGVAAQVYHFLKDFR